MMGRPVTRARTIRESWKHTGGAVPQSPDNQGGAHHGELLLSPGKVRQLGSAPMGLFFSSETVREAWMRTRGEL